jgi:hypothetical protein
VRVEFVLSARTGGQVVELDGLESAGHDAPPSEAV